MTITTKHETDGTLRVYKERNEELEKEKLTIK